MAAMPAQGTRKADLFQELQEATKPEIVERLVGNKVSANVLAADIILDETPMDQDYQQIIL
jgi:hypothetical protein